MPFKLEAVAAATRCSERVQLAGAANTLSFVNGAILADNTDGPALVDVLLAADYDGLAIIELDMSEKPAEQSTIESIAYVRDTLGLVLNPDGGKTAS